MTQAKLFTFEEYLAFDDGTDACYELVNGELVKLTPKSSENNLIARRLLVELLKLLPIELVNYKSTEIQVSGKRATCRVPDLLVLSEELYLAIKGAQRMTITGDMLPPAIVVEVVSPGTTNRDRDYRHKRTEYAARCISEYWIVDPQEQQITVCKWDNGQYEDTIVRGDQRIPSDIVPALEMTVNQVFGIS